jgi:hypothetical protein
MNELLANSLFFLPLLKNKFIFLCSKFIKSYLRMLNSINKLKISACDPRSFSNQKRPQPAGRELMM